MLSTARTGGGGPCLAFLDSSQLRPRALASGCGSRRRSGNPYAVRCPHTGFSARGCRQNWKHAAPALPNEYATCSATNRLEELIDGA